MMRYLKTLQGYVGKVLDALKGEQEMTDKDAVTVLACAVWLILEEMIKDE